MFLFTTPATTTGQAPAAGTVTGTGGAAAGAASGGVVDAIRRGAEQTGTDFAYLLNTAKRESALDPAAKAPTSSASGLFQFIEQTWLGLVKSEGPKLGLSDLAGAITARPDGGFVVGDGEARQAILKLRDDPSLSSLLAGTLTQRNREALATATGRQPSPGELYMAHLLGARGASDLIRSAETDPGRPAAADLPEAAAANRAIFFDRAGKPRSAADLYAALSTTPNGGTVPAATATTSVRPVTVTGEPPLPKLSGPALYGLFQTSERTGPVSGAVAKLWKVNNAPAKGAIAATAYFPRPDGAAPAPEAVAPEPAASAVAEAGPTATPAPSSAPSAGAPLPPARPRSFALRAGLVRR